MHRWLQLSTYHAAVVFIIMGGFASLFAWSSYNLYHLAMENIRLLQQAGWQAAMDGGLLQLIEIIASGAIALACYVGIKACETELVYRWRAWKAEK